MRRAILIWALVGVAGGALVWWVARNTYWTEVKVPMPPKGEALTNPFYAAQRFAEALGAHTAWDRVFTEPAPDAVIVLSGWHWTLSANRRERLERWVESGGRLVVDRMLVGGDDEFGRWSGISRRIHHAELAAAESTYTEPCRSFQEELGDSPSAPGLARRYTICDVDFSSSLEVHGRAAWMLRDRSGLQAARVNVGRGSVTVINAVPFRYRVLFDGDHPSLFVSATRLHRGDAVHFLSEYDHPSLLALAWNYGAPGVMLALVLVSLALWRNAARFGPMAAPPQTARRSLAEQIRGTGEFTWRHGGGEALHAACVRALDEAARRRVHGYAYLSARDRAMALARLTGVGWNALATAIHHPRSRRSHEVRSSIALLETVRRRTLPKQIRGSHA
jgi:hypothetical protein